MPRLEVQVLADRAVTDEGQALVSIELGQRTYSIDLRHLLSGEQRLVVNEITGGETRRVATEELRRPARYRDLTG